MIAILCQGYGKTSRGAEVFADSLSTTLKKLGYCVDILPNASILKNNYKAVISTNGRLDVYFAKLWCITHSSKLIISGQSGPGLDDKLNLWAFPDFFIGLTTFQTDWAKKINPFTKVKTIPNGVDLALFKPQKVQPLYDVLCVAALEPIKRLDLLIKAVAPTGLSLHLVGQGSLKKYLENLGSTLMPGRLTISHYPHDKMSKVYSQARVFAYPTSDYESFGIAIIEAMACNLPLVCTDDPIRREIVGPAGIFTNPADSQKFGHDLLLASSRQWGDLPRSQAKKFSWDDIAKSFDAILSKL
jgi:glycosyltransferase involved in cell wall biosynthesis